MMFCVLTVVATMVSGETALVVGRRAGVSPSSAERLALAFHRVLTEQGTDVLPVSELEGRLRSLRFDDPSRCAGKKACLLELGAQLKVDRLIVLSLAEVAPDFTVTAEGLAVAEGRVLFRETRITTVQGASKELEALADVVARTLAPPPSDIPLLVKQDPPSLQPPPLALELQPPGPELVHRTRTPAILTLTGAILLGTAAGVLGVHSKVFADDANGMGVPGRVSPYTEREARNRIELANVEIAFALGSLVGAVALAVVTMVLWPEATP